MVLFPTAMSVSVICKNTCSTVGEGPHWDGKTQRLIYVDVLSGDVHIYDPANPEKYAKKHFGKRNSSIDS